MAETSDGPISLGLPLPFQIAQLNSALAAQSKAIMSRYVDLNLAQGRVLRLVARNVANTTTSVRKAAAIDKSQFSKALSVLVNLGYVELLPYPEDKRQHLIKLTSKGHAAHDRIAPELDVREKFLLAELSQEEQNALRKAIKVLAKVSQMMDFTTAATVSGQDRLGDDNGVKD